MNWVFAAARPAEDYEILSWHVGGGAFDISPIEPFSIRFRIDPGKPVYVGSFHFVQTASHGLAVTGVKVVYRDTMDRDLPVLRGKYPGFTGLHPEAVVAQANYRPGAGTRPYRLKAEERTSRPLSLAVIRLRR